MVGFDYILGLTCLLLILGIVEGWAHKRQLEMLPIRIHVAGTRGKSSVTRLIASGLNEAGIKTVAKTTGTLARTILPDGRELPVYRPAGANIIEQKRITSVARSFGAQAIVMECMALQPLLHWISEKKMVRATHGVITNARADHLDVMGPGEVDVAKALAGMIPVEGMLYTAEQKHLGVFEEAANERRTRLVGVGQNEIEDITDQEIEPFSYTEHKENVALALKILMDQGIDRETALRGMWKVKPDPGALSEFHLEFFGRDIYFVNGFAANDPDSTFKIWDYAVSKYSDVDSIVGIFNLRGDRPSRTQQMAQDANFWHSANKIVLMGTGSHLFHRLAAKRNVDPAKFVLANDERTEEIFEAILGACTKKTLVIGMGNIGGKGLDLVQFFKNRCKLEYA